MKSKNFGTKLKNYYKENGLKKTINWSFNCVLFEARNYKREKLDYEKIKIKSKEKKYVVEKNAKKIFMFANIPFYDIGGGQRSAQLTKTFNKMGYKVHYIYCFKSNESQIINMDNSSVEHIFIDDLSAKQFETMVNKDDLFIFEAPIEKYDIFLEIAKKHKCKIVYENIDNWETSLGSDIFSENILQKFLKNSDLLVGTAKPLVQQLKDYLKKYQIKNNNVMYLANAVDDDLFCPLKKYIIPDDFIKGEKTLIYYGSLWGVWFDWELIFKLALKNPTYSIILIGDYKGIKDIVENAPNNVHFLGLKSQVELPAYLYYSDYAILPFKADDIGTYVSPLKIFEYISMNKKVLSTSLPDIIGYPNVSYGDTVEQWDKFLHADKEINMEEKDKFILDNNWYDRCSRIIDFFNKKEKCEEKFYDNIAIIILNYNNKNVIFKCIDSLLRYQARYKYEIIVVDNQSSDGSYEALAKEYKNKIKLVKNSKNGCSSGRNLGVNQTDKEFLLFLDSDQWALHKYWLDIYFDIYHTASNVGAIGWAAGWFNSKGLSYHVVDSFKFRYMNPNILCRCDIGYLGSGGMFLSKKLFDEIEGFDEAYDPTCYEDTDISVKVRNAGKEIYYCANLGVFHLPHQTTKSGSAAHKKLIKEKGDYFVNKWKKINKKLLKYKK